MLLEFTRILMNRSLRMLLAAAYPVQCLLLENPIPNSDRTVPETQSNPSKSSRILMKRYVFPPPHSLSSLLRIYSCSSYANLCLFTSTFLAPLCFPFQE